jgi:serine phosphatase RsbU (regulator of sigma subunit)
MANAAICLASTYFKIKNYKPAEDFANISYTLSNELGFPENIKSATKLLSQVYKEQGKYKEAYVMMVVFKQMSDSVNNVNVRNSVVKKQMQYEFDKKEEIAQKDQEKKDELVKEEKRIQRIIIYSVSIVLCLLLVLCIFIYKGYKQKQKANEIITLQKEEVEKQKEVVEHKNEIIEEKQKEILDSINYAKRIQYSLLAHADFLKANIPNHFVYFNPKDIVSGDFYWAAKKYNKFYLAVCDSTGHGVPGAFMSLLNIGFLSEAINEKGIEKPNEVFNYVRNRLIDTISKEGQKDGFDGILICIDLQTKEVTYSAANNKPLLISNNTITELVADRMPVGKGERKEDFKLYTTDIKEGDVLYLYTDGYADQFGGAKGKKFKYKPLNELLLESHNKPLEKQHELLKTAFENWRDDLEQVDDVLVIGIKI